MRWWTSSRTLTKASAATDRKSRGLAAEEAAQSARAGIRLLGLGDPAKHTRQKGSSRLAPDSDASAISWKVVRISSPNVSSAFIAASRSAMATRHTGIAVDTIVGVFADQGRSSAVQAAHTLVMGSIPDGSSKPWSKAQANKLTFSLIPRFMAQKRGFLIIAAARNSRLCGARRFRVAREA